MIGCRYFSVGLDFDDTLKINKFNENKCSGSFVRFYSGFW